MAHILKKLSTHKIFLHLIFGQFSGMFEIDVKDAGTPELYFEDPFELIQVFRTIELQNLNAMIHLESLAGPMADMTMTLSVTEKQIQAEISEILQGIKDLEVKRNSNTSNKNTSTIIIIMIQQ